MVDFPASHVSFRRGTRRAVTKRHEPALPGMYRILGFFSKTLSSFKLPIWHQNLTLITNHWNHWWFFRYFQQLAFSSVDCLNFWRASAGVLGARPGIAGTGGAAESCRRSCSSSSCNSFSCQWPPSSKASKKRRSPQNRATTKTTRWKTWWTNTNTPYQKRWKNKQFWGDQSWEFHLDPLRWVTDRKVCSTSTSRKTSKDPKKYPP